MKVSNILSPGRADRALQPARDRSVFIVVVPMMTLVFAQVVSFHLAVPMLDARDHAASSTDLVAAPMQRKEPG